MLSVRRSRISTNSPADIRRTSLAGIGCKAEDKIKPVERAADDTETTGTGGTGRGCNGCAACVGMLMAGALGTVRTGDKPNWVDDGSQDIVATDVSACGGGREPRGGMSPVPTQGERMEKEGECK